MKVEIKDQSRRRLLPGLAVRDGFMRHPFDTENGVRTSGLVAGRYLKSGSPHDRHATAYYGVAPSVWQSLLLRWQRSGPVAPIGEYTFIDIGAGMGRAVLLASTMPFRAVIGVELNLTLARIARRNAATWRALGRAVAPIHILCRDAVDFDFPAGPCLAFLFNPFGAPVMRRFAAGVARSFAARPRQLDLLYVNNEQEGVLEAQAGFRRQFIGKVRRSSADVVADRAILTNQPDGEYAWARYEDCSIWRWIGKQRVQAYADKGQNDTDRLAVDKPHPGRKPK